MERFNDAITDEAQTLKGRRVSIQINRIDVQKPITGKIMRILDSNSFDLKLPDDNLPRIFLVLLDRPLAISPFPLNPISEFRYALVFSWSSRELHDLIIGRSIPLQGGFHIYLANEKLLSEKGISIENDKLQIEDTYGCISKEVDIRLLD